jgi:Protein of unknown function (DUF3313)
MGKTGAGGRGWGALATALAALGLAACAAGQSGKAKPSGFLGDYSKLHAGEKGEALLVYVDPQASFAKYRKVMIDPVTIWRNVDTAAIPPADARELIDELELMLRITLDDDYEVVTQPGPDVLRVRAAITEAEGSWVPGSLADRLDSDLQDAGVAAPSKATRGFVGRAGIEAELLDAASGTRVAAAVDRRAGAQTFDSTKGTWDDVEQAFAHWADRLRDRLRELRHRG